MVFTCINLHFTDFCNYKCKHCFVKKENYELTFEELKVVVDKVEKYFKSKNVIGRINIAGGEPLLSRNIDRLIEYIASKKIKISIITNGYYLNDSFIRKNKNHIETIGISVDSLDYDTNIMIGRCFNNNVLSEEKIIYLSKRIKDAGIKLKINTCVSKLNYKENFNDFINKIKPDRFKVLKMMCNSSNEVYNNNAISNDDIKKFLENINYDYVYESDEEMKNSYLIIDSKGNLSTNNLHLNNISIFDYDIDEVIDRININYENYIKRYI